MAPASTPWTCPGWLCFLLLALAATPAWGLSSDREQPIEIEADRASLDEGQGISVYEGNVVLRQGTLQLSGQRMTVYLRNKQVEKVELTGQPAGYSQRFDGEDTDQRAEAGHIEYRTAEQRMILLHDARIWREQAEEFSSDRIVINLRDNTLNAGGDGPSGRVRIILQPQTWQTDEEVPGQ